MFPQKQNKEHHTKTELDEKKLAISPLHVKRCLPYMIKDGGSEEFQNRLTNEKLILDQ